jgi:transcriptional regulator with XRE-family HTH domain
VKKKRGVNLSVDGDVTGNIIIGDGNSIFQPADTPTHSRDTFFDIGHRLKQVREEIDLQSSQFTELLGVTSERQYLAMENRQQEVPSSLLEKVHAITGIELEWLKHGKEPRYKVRVSAFRTAGQGLEFMAQFKPRHLFFVLGKSTIFENWNVCLVAQTGDYCFQVIDHKTSLNFWNWCEDFWFIPVYFEFLSILRDTFPLDPGIALPGSWYKKLITGQIHFLRAQKELDSNFLFWPDAVLDVNCQKRDSERYERLYGKWITKMRETYHDVVALVAKSAKPGSSWLNHDNGQTNLPKDSCHTKDQAK